MKNITLILFLFFVQNSFALIEVDRIVNFHESINEKDKSIPEGQAILKMNLNELDVMIHYKEKNGTGWSNWKFYKQNSKKMLVDTLPSGEYQFKFEKIGKSQVYGHVNLSSQYYVEVVVSMYEEVPIEHKVLKPAVYLYSDVPVDLSIKVNPAGQFDFTYPNHGTTGWQVHVDDKGLTCNGTSYDYLFWDAKQSQMDFNYNLGFVIKGEETVAFLEDKLSAMGLNDREKQDFIAFWGPKLVKNDYNYLHFIMNEAYAESIGSIESSVEIESSLRLFMAYKPLSAPVPVLEQEIEEFKRVGFTLVEWGGGEVFKNQVGL